MSYRIFIYILGIVTNFFGVALVINAMVGAGFWQSLFIGLSDIFGLTVGFWNGATQLVLIFINSWLIRKSPEFLALIPLVLESLALDFWLEIGFAQVNLVGAPLVLRLLLMLLGIVFIGIGIALYLFPQLPRSPIIQVTIVISHRFEISLRFAQTLIAIVVATAALMIGGPVGIGTVALTMFSGVSIQYFYSSLYLTYRRFLPSQNKEIVTSRI
ncbi:YitT family protein [Pontibacillus salicampi]|uniref:YitT family protein n=1 Tax=Pontibacillus salicampi TaxID=1449801 RepID=A0ABV6LU13_9BACI